MAERRLCGTQAVRKDPSPNMDVNERPFYRDTLRAEPFDERLYSRSRLFDFLSELYADAIDRRSPGPVFTCTSNHSVCHQRSLRPTLPLVEKCPTNWLLLVVLNHALISNRTTRGSDLVETLPPPRPFLTLDIRCVVQTSGGSCYGSNSGCSDVVAEGRRALDRADEGCQLDCSGPLT